jgi:hypothetical protein
MGFHRRSEQMHPVITPREYVFVLGIALEDVARGPVGRGRGYQHGAACLAAGQPELAVEAFRRFLRRHPRDPFGHRMLGLAYLGAGQFKQGFAHLVLALKFLTTHGAHGELSIPLCEGLRFQLEAGMVRLLLLPLCMRLGLHASAAQLIIANLAL